jgi:hypothetical protein
MNWGRGLIRLWLVVAIPWIAVAGYLRADNWQAAYGDYSGADNVSVDEKACANPDPQQQAICDLQRRLQHQSTVTRNRAASDMVATGQWVLGPPLALAFAMVALAWVIRGFRR